MLLCRQLMIVLSLAVLIFVSETPLRGETATDSSARPRTYSNPILTEGSPADPDVILVDGTYYLYPTTHGRGYDAWTSTDLVNWQPRGSVFKAPHGGAWAPDVFHNKRGDGKFYLYYTDSGPECAVARTVGQSGLAWR